MADEILQRDPNHIVVLGGVTDDASQEIRMLRIDPVTKRLLVSAVGLGTVTSLAGSTGILLTPDPITTTGTIGLSTALAPIASLAGNSLKFLRVNVGETAVEWSTEAALGTVTSVSVVTANGVSGSVATATTTPAITITLGAITPTSVNGLTITTTTGTFTLTNGKTLTVLKTMSFNAADDTGVYTLPTGTKTLVATDVTTLSSLVSVGTITTGVWNATDIPVSAGGTGLSTISALSIWVANSADVITQVTPGAGNSIRVNGAGNAWEAFTPSSDVPTVITVANEATDTTCFIAFFTAATGDLGPKTNANMTFNSNTGVATFASTVLTTTDINGGTIDATVIGGATPAAVTSTIVVVDNITIDLNTISSTSGNINITPVAGSNITFDGTVTLDGGVVAGITTLSITSFGANWTNAGRTVADLGIVTTVDINGGTIDGVTIGGASAGAATFTTVTGTTITASVGFALGDGDYIGITSNETLVFNAAGTIAVTGAHLDMNGNNIIDIHGLKIDGLPDTDHTCNGPQTDSFQSGYTAAQFDLVFMGSGGKWLEVDSDAVATCKGMIGLSMEAKNDTEAMLVALPGSFVRDDTWNWTVGATLYAGETLGAMQETIPTGADAIIKVVAFAVTADIIFFNPSPDQQSTVA